MGYMKRMQQRCWDRGCKRRPDYAVFYFKRNKVHGYFCLGHAEMALARVKAEEADRTNPYYVGPSPEGE